jgi:hypothetical protein
VIKVKDLIEALTALPSEAVLHGRADIITRKYDGVEYVEIDLSLYGEVVNRD